MHNRIAGIVRTICLLGAVVSSVGCTPIASVDSDSDLSISPDHEVFRDCEHCPEMVVVEPGTLLYDSARANSDVSLAEVVAVDYYFAVGRYEITVGEWRQCVAAKFCRDIELEFNSEDDQEPVVGINWYEAIRYTEWLSLESGESYRLLTIVEWEYAAKAERTYRTYEPISDRRICNFANVYDNSAHRFGSFSVPNRCRDGFGLEPAPVGSFRPNAFGIYDMLGNVPEWVVDCSEYRGDVCSAHYALGGSWASTRGAARPTHRRLARSEQASIFGIRVARNVDQSRRMP